MLTHPHILTEVITQAVFPNTTSGESSLQWAPIRLYFLSVCPRIRIYVVVLVVHGEVFESHIVESIVSLPAVSHDSGAGRYMLFNQSFQCRGVALVGRDSLYSELVGI